MLQSKTVIGQVMKSSTEPWPFVQGFFRRKKGSFTDLEQLPPDKVPFVTDGQGRFSVILWCTSQGVIPTTYEGFLSCRDEFLFELSDTDPDPVQVSELRKRYLASHPDEDDSGNTPIINYAPLVHRHNASDIDGLSIIPPSGNTQENWLTTTTNRMASDNTIYLVRNQSPTNDPIQLILPSDATLGFKFKVLSVEGKYQITQNNNQQVRFGNILTSLGLSGKIVSADEGDCIEIACVNPPNIWAAFLVIGNLSFF